MASKSAFKLGSLQNMVFSTVSSMGVHRVLYVWRLQRIDCDAHAVSTKSVHLMEVRAGGSDANAEI